MRQLDSRQCQGSSRSSTRLAGRVCLLAALLLSWACGGGEAQRANDDAQQSSPPAETAPAATTAEPMTAPLLLGSSLIGGTVSFAGKAPRLRPLAMEADPGCAAKHSEPVMPEFLVLGEGQSLANVFVQVTNPPAGTFASPAAAAVINQVGCRYEPHVLGVIAGQKLIFRNSDGLLHNVHGQPAVNREFNIGMPPTVTESEKVLSRPEPLFPVKCDVHPWMRSYVAVVSHPFFAVSGADGSFTIDGLPAGTWEIEAWHERLGTQSASVTLGEGEAGTSDFSFSAPQG